MSDEIGTQFQSEHGHFRGKVGHCPFCCRDAAELWYEPTEDWKPFQVRCTCCGACGPWGDCGEGVAVPAWKSVVKVSAGRAALDEGGGADG